MYTQTRLPTTQPKESWIPLLTPRRTRSTGPASGNLPLPSRTNSRASHQNQSDIPFSRSVIFAQNTLAQLSAIEEQREAGQLLDHSILTPVSPQTVAEPSPRQAFQPQLSSTPTLHISSAMDEERAPRLHEWYWHMTGRGSPPEPPAASTTGVLRSTLPGTPFHGPYPSFNMAWDRTPSVAPHLFPQPHCAGTMAPRGNTPLFLLTSHVSSPAPS